MKKKYLIVAVLALVATLSITLFACKPKSFNLTDFKTKPDSFSEMELVADKNAVDFFTSAIETWKSDNYRADVVFAFGAKAAGQAINLNYNQTFIKNGNEFYDKFVQFGEGPEANSKKMAHEFYYNGSAAKAKYLGQDNKSEKKIPAPDESGMIDFDFKELGKEWGGFDKEAKYNITNGFTKPQEHKDYLTTKLYSYNLTKDTIIAESNKVYKDGDSYYGEITLDCMNDSVITTHPDVIDAIKKATGGEFKQFDANTTMLFEIKEIDGKLRLVQMLLTEKYTGSKNVIIIGQTDVTCEQEYWYTFRYDNSSIKIPKVA